MSSLRVNIAGRLLKPITPAVQTKLTAAQALIADLKTYATKINSTRPNEENSISTVYDNQAGWIDFKIDLSIAESPTGTLVLSTTDPITGLPVGGIKIPAIVVPKLANLRTAIRDFKQYLSNNGGVIMTQVFICHHDSNGVMPDEPRIEI